MSAANINLRKVSLLKQIRSLIHCLVNIKDETGEFLMTLEDGRVIDTKGWNDWEVSVDIKLRHQWTDRHMTVDPWDRLIFNKRVPNQPIDHSVERCYTGLYGLLKFHEITGDEDALRISLAWFKDRFEIGTTKNVNTMSPLLTAAYLHESKQANYFVHLDAWAEWVMHEMPRTDEGGLQHITYLVDNKQQLWDDTLMMSVLPLTKIGLVLSRPDYIEEAKRQFLLHIKYLADVQTGLWFHGEFQCSSCK